MRVVIPDDYHDAVRRLPVRGRLIDHELVVYNDTVKDIAALAERFRDADALVLIRERTAITAELLERLPNLKLISQTGRGTSHIDVDACTRRGVVVCAGSGSPYAPAELTLALMLAATRRVAVEAERLRAGRWQAAKLGTTLRGRMLGIFGYGKIGTLVAGYAKPLGMQILVWGRSGSQMRARTDGHAVAASRNDFFSRADVVSLHLRLTNETRGIVTLQDLLSMKKHALLVNTSRAELIQPGALVAALTAGRPGFAAVDVFEEEPVLGAAHPLLAMENVLCTPHLGYVESDSYQMYFGEAFRQVVAFAEGKPINVVNPQ